MTSNTSTLADNGSGIIGGSISLRKMECLCCKVVVFPPVWQCRYWHSVCNFCRQKLDTCPEVDCEERISLAIRSTVAEIFLEKHVLRCKYFRDGAGGCMEATLKDDADLMQAHETICHFREVKCLVPGCYKFIKFTALADHFDKDHFIPRFPCDNINLNTSKMILKREILNETLGERTYKVALMYSLHEASILLTIFRMTSLRQPVFEISTIIHTYYTEPIHKDYRCKISATNEEDVRAKYNWCGPVNQTYSLTPLLSVQDETAKLKWAVKVEIFPCANH